MSMTLWDNVRDGFFGFFFSSFLLDFLNTPLQSSGLSTQHLLNSLKEMTWYPDHMPETNSCLKPGTLQDFAPTSYGF